MSDMLFSFKLVEKNDMDVVACGARTRVVLEAFHRNPPDIMVRERIISVWLWKMTTYGNDVDDKEKMLCIFVLAIDVAPT